MRRDCQHFHFQSGGGPAPRARSSRPSACTLRAPQLFFSNIAPSCGCFSLERCPSAQSCQHTGGGCQCGRSKKSSRARLWQPALASCGSSSRRSKQTNLVTQLDAVWTQGESKRIKLTTAWSSIVLFMPLSILFVAVRRKWFSIRRFSRAPNIFFCFSTERGVVGNVLRSLFLIGVRVGMRC